MIYAGKYNHMPEFFNKVPPVWLKDAEAPSCLLCNTHFSFVTRKHHCRNCGKIFCVNCCSMKEKLPELGFFDPVRVCRSCSRDITNDHYVLKNSKQFLREVIKRADIKLLKWVLYDNNQIPSIFKNLDDSFLDPPDNKNNNDNNNIKNGADNINNNNNNNNAENNDNIPLKPAEIVKLFLDAGAKADQPIDSGAEKNKTLLFLAAAKGNIEIVKILLKAGATVDKCCDDKTSPLFVACVQGHSNIVKKLLQSKASVNLCRESVSPLYISAFNGNTEIVKILLDAGALVDSSNPLFTTIKNNNTEITKMLLDAGATADNLIANNSLTPLLLATENKNTEVIKLLLNAGATVDKSIPGNNVTALHLAVKNNCVDIVKVLVMNGADTSIPFSNNGEKKTVWEMSAGNEEMTKALNITWSPQTHFLLNRNTKTTIAMVLWMAKKQKWVIDREIVDHIISFLLPVKMANKQTKRASQENNK